MRTLTIAVWLVGFAAVAAEPALRWKDIGEGRMELLDRGRVALVYNYGPQLKAGAPENKRRCCYIFPVYTPAGVSMLDDFPQDHWHHRGLFWAWPIIETEGARYDGWMMFTSQERAAQAPVTRANGREARLETRNVWEAGGKDIVRERLLLTILPARGGTRQMEVELTWEAIHAPVTLAGSPEAGKSYGGLCARFAPREKTILRADNHVVEKDEDLAPHGWAELDAVYGGKRAVLRITPDERNPGVPYQWCLRHYGFVGASFPGRSAAADHHTLEPGKPLTLRFRVLVSDVGEGQ
jgi:hypothetical protein